MENSSPQSKPHNRILMVANWESDVGYAWWLMESFWIAISDHLEESYESIIAYPEIATVPEGITKSIKLIKEYNFRDINLSSVLSHCRFIRTHNIKIIYFTDKSSWHWNYIFYKLAGVKKIIVHDHTPGLRKKPAGIKYLIKYQTRL